MERDGELVLLMDSRLSADARVLGLYIAKAGDGERPRAELMGILNAEAGPGRVRRALAQLEHFGWISRTPGGRGHSDCFAFRVPESDTLNGSLGNETPEPVKDRVPEIDTLKIKSVDLTHSKPDRVATLHTLNAHQLEEDRQKKEPPVVPLWLRAFEKYTDEFTGFRDSMRDYLEKRVPEDRRDSYCHTVAGWLNDIHPGIWQKPDGGWLAKEHRPPLLAAAFNELAAGDEKVMKRPVGDPGNLATKLEILIKQWARSNERSSTAANGRGDAGKGGSGANPGGNQTSRRKNGYGG